jgi:altronate hydrolase
VTSAPPLIVLDPADSVGISTRALRAGDAVATPDGRELVVRTQVRPGHKVALRDHDEGEPVIKYGAQIGIATARILEGDHVHTQNLVTVRGRRHTPSAGRGAS